MGPPFFMLVFSFRSYYASVIRKSNSALGRNTMPSDRTALFNILFPKADPRIRSLPPTEIYEEQFLDLHSFRLRHCPSTVLGPFPSACTKVRWMFCTLLSKKRMKAGFLIYSPSQTSAVPSTAIKSSVSVCRMILARMTLFALGGRAMSTIPAYCRQGIALKFVKNTTIIFKEQGCDLSRIHYTGVRRWYARLGYQTLLKRNAGGIILQQSGI